MLFVWTGAEAEVVGAGALVDVGSGDVVVGRMDVMGMETLEVVDRMGRGVAESWPSSSDAVAEPAKTTSARRLADSSNARRACGIKRSPR
jgi:hypothetical protein